MNTKSVLPRYKRNRYTRATLAGDAIGIAHFIVANIVLVLGSVTDVFKNIDYKHGGMRFLYEYLDAPVYYFLKGYIGDTRIDPIYMFIAAELVIVTSSIVYGLIAYLILRIIAALFA